MFTFIKKRSKEVKKSINILKIRPLLQARRSRQFLCKMAGRELVQHIPRTLLLLKLLSCLTLLHSAPPHMVSLLLWQLFLGRRPNNSLQILKQQWKLNAFQTLPTTTKMAPAWCREYSSLSASLDMVIKKKLFEKKQNKTQSYIVRHPNAAILYKRPDS